MIKRFTFARRRTDVSPPAFRATWLGAVGWATLAPPDARPVRVSSGLVVPGFDTDPPYDGVGIEWFTDADHLARYLAWLRDRPAPGRALTSTVTTAEEAVLRGAGWLERRWRGRTAKLKHMALAQRADGLTATEFSARWRGHAGTVGAGVVIPDEARGRAYVQNHSRCDGPYDAVNEVYFDDAEEMRTRIDWLRANLADGPDPLFSRSWFLPLRECVILGG